MSNGFNFSDSLLPPLDVFGSEGRRPVKNDLTGLVTKGEHLFFNETFGGNGRTCGTCHRRDNNLTIDPRYIASLPASDPLFVSEFNPALAGLEDSDLLRGPRGLILENVDGFDQPPVFRAPPSLHNVSLTPPFGLSGEFMSIADFTVGAIAQHFPKSLARVAGVDFKLPTQEELDALVAFQESIFLPGGPKFQPG